MALLSSITDYSSAVEPSFVSAFGGVGDATTNNNTAFANAEASSFERIFLAPGRYLTTTDPGTFTKHYVGPGKIYYPSGGQARKAFQNAAWYQTKVPPTADPLSEYGFALDAKFGDPTYHVIKPGTRRNFDRYLQTAGNPNGYSTYFWAPSTPQFSYFFSQSGWSGLSGLLAATAAVGATTAQISGGTAGWAVGDVVGFVPSGAQDGIPTDTVTVTATSGTTITFTPALTHAYGVGNVVSHGYRTMNAHTTIIDEHTGGGDNYAFLARMIASYPALASQSTYSDTATIGIIGGDMTLTQDYNYATGWEAQYIDTGHDVCVAGSVNSYIRTNNTGGRGVFWAHDYAKMDAPTSGNNLKPIDGVWCAAMYAKTGLDLSRSVCSVAAVAIPIGQKIALNASVVSPGPTNGNGLVATTDGGIYLWASSDGAGTFAQIVNGPASVLLRPGSLQINVATDFGGNAVFAGSLTTASNVTVGGALNVAGDANVNGTIVLPYGHQVRWGTNNTYIIADASNLAIYVNGVQKVLY